MTDPTSRRAGPSGPPASVSALLDRSAGVLRRRWAVLIALSTLFGIPAALLGAAGSLPLAGTLERLLPADGSLPPPGAVGEAEVREVLNGVLIAMGASALAGALASIAAVGAAWVTARHLHGLPARTGEGAVHALSRALPAIALSLVTLLAIGAIAVAGGVIAIGSLALFPGPTPATGGPGPFLAIVAGVAATFAIIVLQLRWAAAPTLVALGDGPLTALRASWALTRRSALRTAALLVLSGLLAAIAMTIVGGILAALLGGLLAESVGIASIGELSADAIVAILFAPVTPVVLTVLTLDLQGRSPAS